MNLENRIAYALHALQQEHIGQIGQDDLAAVVANVRHAQHLSLRAALNRGLQALRRQLDLLSGVKPVAPVTISQDTHFSMSDIVLH